MLTTSDHDLFRHLGADKAALYRRILAVFAAALRQYQLQLRPDEVLAQGDWGTEPVPRIEDIQAALDVFAASLQRRAGLQTVALEDIAMRLQALCRLAAEGRGRAPCSTPPRSMKPCATSPSGSRR